MDENKENPMQKIRIEKITVNMGVGGSAEEMKKAVQIIEKITGSRPVQTKCRVKQPGWDIRPGLPIGVKVTLRNSSAEEFLRNALSAKEGMLKTKSFDRNGNFGFGIHEYIDLPKIKYDPKLGIRGLDVLVTLEKPGYRIKKRKIQKAKVGGIQRVSREDAIGFMKEKFGAEIV